MPGNNILHQWLAQPQQVQLPNGRAFFAKYQRVGRHVLNPTCVRINQTYVWKIGPKKVGTCIDLLTGIDLEKKAAGSSAGKMIIKDAINTLRTAYKKIRSKITNE